PADSLTAPNLPAHPWPALRARDDFDAPELGPHWQSPRAPIDADMASLTARPGFLRLHGRESIVSNFEQSLVARRQQAFRIEASMSLLLSSHDIRHMFFLLAF